jgi:hypothetical protein
MTDTITIPPEALRAARAASMNALGDGEDAVKAACLAMLTNWPGMINWVDGIGRPKSITLPLQEPSDDK